MFICTDFYIFHNPLRLYFESVHPQLYLGTPPPPTSPIMGQGGTAAPSDCNMKMIDYDTYIANRRPGSTAPSEASTTKMSYAVNICT